MKKMKFILGAIALLAGVTSFTACGGSDSPDEEKILKLTNAADATILFNPGDVTAKEVQITSNVTWSISTVSPPPAWVTVNKLVGKISITAAAAIDTPRSGMITISADGLPSIEINLSQGAAVYEATLSPAILEIPKYNFDTLHIDVKASSPYWTVASSETWAKVEKASSKIVVSVESNPTTSERSATVTLTMGLNEFTSIITQEAGLADGGALFGDFEGTYSAAGDPAWLAVPGPATWTSIFHKANVVEFFPTSFVVDGFSDMPSGIYMYIEYINGRLVLTPTAIAAGEADGVDLIFVQGAASITADETIRFNDISIELEWDAETKVINFPTRNAFDEELMWGILAFKTDRSFYGAGTELYKNMKYTWTSAATEVGTKISTKPTVRFFNPLSFYDLSKLTIDKNAFKKYKL